jgi:WD40 repeat protein
VAEETPLILNEEVEGDQTINDVRFSPFSSLRLIGGACQDGAARFWKLPEGGLTENRTSADATLVGHTKRLLLVDYHPLSETVVVTSGADYEVKLWDLNQTEHPVLELPKIHKGLITGVSWSHDGTLLATAGKDKNLRLFDPRGNTAVGEVASHQGTKSGKVIFLGSKNVIATVGFSKTSDREITLHDIRNVNQKLTTVKVDNSPSTPLPFWEDDNTLLYLTGKGDGNVRIYEFVDSDPFLHLVNEFKAKEPATGVAKLPRSVNEIMKCEITRFLKLTPQGQVIPIRFEIPRQNMAFFQDDLFPDTWDGNPALSAQEWFSGQNKTRNTVSLKP